MERLAHLRGRLRGRAFYGFVAYWGVNVVLVLAELHWHILYRLTLLDIALIRTAMAPVPHAH